MHALARDVFYGDEYQDVNPAQTALIKAMVPPNGKLRVVGDDLQSRGHRVVPPRR